MYKLFSTLLLVVFLSPLVAAQDKDKRFEIFGGYSFLNIDVRQSGSPIDRVSGRNGFIVAATGYLTKRFGVTGDFSAGFSNDGANVSGGSISYKSTSFSYLAGPHFRFSNKTRVTPFVHALAGISNNRFSYRFTPTGSGTAGVKVSQSTNDFALAIGGGLDIRAGDRVSIRAFQVDYNPTFVQNRSQYGTNSGGRFDNMRFSIGVVFK